LPIFSPTVMTMRFQPIMVPRPSAIVAKSSTPRNITPEAGCLF